MPTDDPWWKNSPDGYEVMPEFKNDQGETLSASYTPSNGIRLQIINDDLSENWVVYDLDAEEAQHLGEALLRWAKAHSLNRLSTDGT